MFQDLTQGALYDTDTAMEVMEQISLMEMLDCVGSSNKKSRARLNNANRQKVSAPKFKKKLARPAKRIDIGNAVLTEAKSMEELVETNDYSFNPDEFEKVKTVEELLGIEPIAEPVIDEEFSDKGAEVVDETEDLAPKSKCTDLELAVAVINGSNTELTEEDFDESVWQEANDFYLDEEVDYKEEVSPEGETIMIMSGERFATYMTNRANTVSSWSNNTEEVAPIPMFSPRMNILLDVIIDNQLEFHDRYKRHYAEDESYKKCLNCRELMQTGIDADDLTDKALARALYMTIKHSSINTKICNKYSKLAGLDISKTYEQMRKQYIDELLTRDDLIEILAELDEYDIYGELIGLAA
jgi:hypothetical protein